MRLYARVRKSGQQTHVQSVITSCWSFSMHY